MTPWQVAFGLTIALFVPIGFGVSKELEYLSGYWGWLWSQYWYSLGLFLSTTFLVFFFGFYQVARVLSLGDVGSRIKVSIVREGGTSG